MPSALNDTSIGSGYSIELDLTDTLNGYVSSVYGMCCCNSSMLYLSVSRYSLNLLLYFSSISSVVVMLAGHTKNILRLPSLGITNYKTLHRGIKTPGSFFETISSCFFNLFLTVDFINSPTVQRSASWHNYCICAVSNLLVSSLGLVNNLT